MTPARCRELVRASAVAAGDTLDDLTRARVLARVQARLSASERGRRPAATRSRLMWALGCAAVTVLAFVLGTRLRTPQPGVAGGTLALEPYAVHLPAAPGSAVPGKGLDRLQLPAHASMRARLGAAADLTLLGPLELIVRDTDKQRAELALGRGTLLGDFDGRGGRSLRIATPDATVDIVGTRFLVDASASGTRVAVAHGLVRVESNDRVRMVGAGQAWRTDGDAMTPVDEGTARLFEGAALGQWEELASPAPAQETRAAAAETEAARADAKNARVQVARAEVKTPRAVHQRPARARRAHGAGSVRVEVAPGQASTPPRANADRRLALAETPPPPPRAVAPPGEAPPAAAASPASPPAAPPEAAPSKPGPEPAAAPRATVSSLYKEAEQALARGDDATAKQHLAALVRAFPRDAMADSARFELALLAHKGGDRREALAQIREILGRGAGEPGASPFLESARFLRCRVYLDEDRDAAETCLVRFLRDHSRSSHGEVALQALIELARAKAQCGKAAQHAEEYLRRYPKGRFSEEATRVRSRCGP